MSDMRRKRILIVDDDQGVHVALKHSLKSQFDCLSAYNTEEAKTVLASNGPFDLALLDLNMRYEEEGLKFLPQLKELEPDMDVIVASSNTKKDLVRQAIQAGASAWLVKDFSADQLLVTIEAVFQRRELLKEREHHRLARDRSLLKAPLIGKSPPMRNLAATIEKVRRSRANVLITGETGTGKELVARHIGSPDGKPFVAVDSSTITSSMAESLLFGHEKGAFTGAHATTKGLFEEADGGAIYFDEIGNMPLEIQSKLLRVIQEKEINRIGSRKTIFLDFRVISATNRDLDTMAKEGAFKYDLLQRINVIPIHVPPLRDRKEDIPVLVGHFLGSHATEGGPTVFSEQALAALTQYDWPGNVRELSNVVAYLCAMVVGRDSVEVEDLPPKILAGFKSSAPMALPKASDLDAMARSVADAFVPGDEIDFYALMGTLEGKVLANLYERFKGNITQLGKAIKVSRSHLYSKLYAHGIHK